MGDRARLDGMARYGIETRHAVGVTVTELRRVARGPRARPRARGCAVGLRRPRGAHPRVAGRRARAGVGGADGGVGGRPGLVGRVRPGVRQSVRPDTVRPGQGVGVERPRTRVREACRVRAHGVRGRPPQGRARRRVRVAPAGDPRTGDRRSELRQKAISWALRQIGKRSAGLNAKAIRTAEQIERIDARSATVDRPRRAARAPQRRRPGAAARHADLQLEQRRRELAQLRAGTGRARPRATTWTQTWSAPASRCWRTRSRDPVDVAPRDHRVDQRVAPLAGDVGVGPPHALQVPRVVLGLQVVEREPPGDARGPATDRSRARRSAPRRAPGRDRAAAARTPCARPARSTDARRARARRRARASSGPSAASTRRGAASGSGADDGARSIASRYSRIAESGRSYTAAPASDRARVAHPDPEEEPPRVRVREHPPAVGHRGRVARPDVRDPASRRPPARFREEPPRVRERPRGCRRPRGPRSRRSRATRSRRRPRAPRPRSAPRARSSRRRCARATRGARHAPDGARDPEAPPWRRTLSTRKGPPHGGPFRYRVGERRSALVPGADGLGLREQHGLRLLARAPRRSAAAATGATRAGTSCGRRAASSPTGTRIDRTIVASMKTATARPNPICWSAVSRPAANPANTATMMIAAPVMIPPVVRRPYATASVLSPGLVVLLPDPRQQEHVVVHRQAEQDREQEQREPRLDRIDLLEPERVRDGLAERRTALLEDQHDQRRTRPPPTAGSSRSPSPAPPSSGTRP